MGPQVREFGANVKIRPRFLARLQRGPLVPCVLTLSAALSLSWVAWGEPILHELFSPDPEEDRRYLATTSSGAMASGMQTKSGWVNAPDPTERAGSAAQHTYGGQKQSAQSLQEFSLDNLTTRPNQVRYDEPFRPSILPYKRISAFDTLKNNFSLGVRDQGLSHVEVGGAAAETEDAFFGDYEVDLLDGVPVRVPTVGPSARLLALQIDPPTEAVMLKDGADNWFLQAERGGRVHVFVQLSIDRRVFGSQFAPVSRSALRPYVDPLPAPVFAAAREVMAGIGGLEGRPPAGVLMTLVDYFRHFEESTELPTAQDPVALYKEISLSQKGVCRHRAYAFVVTALAWGLPARLVVNEAHAWVEVFDTEIWHRIDLGGAASDLMPTRNEPLSVRHRAPPDPFTWPTDERPASTEFERRLTQNHPSFLGRPNAPSSAEEGAAPAPGWVEESSQVVSGSSVASTGDPGHPGDSSGASEAGSPSGTVVQFQVARDSYRRGTPLSVVGSAHEDGEPCALSRIDIRLDLPRGPITIGSLATDRSGAFKGEVTLPGSLPVGPLQVSAAVGAGCRKL